MNGKKTLSAEDVLRRYTDELLPEFVELSLTGINQRGNFGNTPLHLAAVRGELGELRALLEAGADVNAKGQHDDTPLHDAAIKGNLSVILELLNAGAEVNAQNEFGHTALDVALRRGHTDVVAAIDNWVESR